MTILKRLLLIGVGGALYAAIETVARGYTHWTMFVLGGVCFWLVGGINEITPKDWAITTQALVGAFLITFAELVAGVVLNIGLGWNVWDYSDMPYNLWGQICVENSFYWLLLSVVAIVLDDWLRAVWFDEPKPKYHL